MSIKRVGLRLLLGVATILVLPVIIGHVAHAGYIGEFKDYTYFTGKQAPSNLQFIKNKFDLVGGERVFHNYYDEGGSFSYSPGYVMPNRKNTFAGYDGDTGQGGAVGTLALNEFSDAVDDKEKLFKLLKDRNTNGTAWEKMGSALIVNQMLGVKAPKSQSGALGIGAQVVSDAQWSDLERRLVNNTAVIMTLVPKYSVVNKMNTSGVLYYSGGEKIIDVVDYYISGKGSETGEEYAWVFKVNGIEKYVLEVNCANPIGNWGGFDVPKDDTYSLTPTLTAPPNGGTVKRKGEVTATGEVVKSGTAPAGSKNWYITRLTYDSGKNPANKLKRTSLTNGTRLCDEFANNNGCSVDTRSGTFDTNTPVKGSATKFTVPDDAKDGTQYCWVVSVRDPTQVADKPVWQHSAMNCVEVSVVFTLTPSILSVVNDNKGKDVVANGGEIARGTEVFINNRVRNGGPDTSGAFKRTITRIAYKEGAVLNMAASTNTGVACEAFSKTDRFNSGALGCSMVANLDDEDALAASSNRDRILQDKHTISSSYTAGTKVCFVESINRYEQGKVAADGWKHSSMYCVVITKSFELKPVIDNVFGGLSDSSVIEQGASGDVKFSVENSGVDAAENVEWRLTHYVYVPGKGPQPDDKKGRDADKDPCEEFLGHNNSSVRSMCTNNADYGGWVIKSTTFPAKSSTYNGIVHEKVTYSVPEGAKIGTKLCWVASVSRPTTSTTPVWRHSAMHCLTVGKKPKVQIWGGDVRAGVGIDTSKSTFSNGTFGSWGEYAALSKKINSGFASGLGLNGENKGVDQSSWSSLTFANTGKSALCEFGCYDFTLTAPSVAGQFTSSLDKLDGGTYMANGNVDIAASRVGEGKTIIIVATGTVTIKGNIIYEDTGYTSIRNIPQLIIKAPTINIENSAEKVDAWLLAVGAKNSGVLNTCSNVDKDAKLTINMCDKRLTVNGPVIADKIYLRRTGGSDAQPTERGKPAEVFNLRADAYLWASAYGSDKSRAQTVYSRELSPRF